MVVLMTMTPKSQTRPQRSHSEVTPLEVQQPPASPTANPSTHDGIRVALSRRTLSQTTIQHVKARVAPQPLTVLTEPPGFRLEADFSTGYVEPSHNTVVPGRVRHLERQATDQTVQHDFQRLTASSMVAAGLLRQELSEEKAARQQLQQLFDEKFQLAEGLYAQVVRMETETSEMNDVEIELREALEESIQQNNSLKEEKTYLDGCLRGQRYDLQRTSNRTT